MATRNQEERLARKLSQLDLALEAGISQEYLAGFIVKRKKYLPEEYAILKSTGQPIPLQVHIVK